MKIIAVMGSPRGKGAGYQIVRMIEEKMKTMGSTDFEYLFLKDLNLKLCTGCYTCLSAGENRCPLIKDDRAVVEQKLLAADGVILSSPMYVLNVSWLMKNFIDRFAYTTHRPKFHRQKVLSIVNMGGDNPEITLSLLKNALAGSQIVHELGIATPPWAQTQRAVTRKEQAIDEAAKKFYSACLNTTLPIPKLKDLISFHIMQKIFLKCRQYLPADYEFYNGKGYYYDTSINPVKAAAAKAIAGVTMNMMKDLGPGSVPWPAP
ncbi:flavodoxin family protein [Candidatus Magnetominusculus xianensis]|uniref:NADPH-dependent FMN reductase n=1 Tax=Candidatus Magnetominusculus xianensis TaxID=1748249 RepID=A0ABR5SI62_9BACT|nr:flavodoxin family protein [Candidatus Magnetominusculus xianensis]KWT83489.1 NADPH-dependent FMN reductase [Candidatus Magnetominusculus xianensis]MBF0404129.1 flavodoxin family protein [Nitrospirota bacterium]